MVAPISVSFAYVLYKIVTVQTVQIFLMIYKKRTKKQTEKIAIFNNSLAQLFELLRPSNILFKQSWPEVFFST